MQLRRELKGKLEKTNLISNDLVKKVLCHAIVSYVKALLKNGEFVKRTVKQYFYSAFELNESRIRTAVSRSIESSLKDI